MDERGRWDHVVVGAGSAGCVVAARLSADPARRVLLLEAGPDHAEGGGRYLPDVLAQGHRFWPDALAAKTPGGAELPYLRGRGVGGTSAVNGMLCLPGLPADYDAWADEHGCPGWAWADVAPWLHRLKRTLRRPAPGQLTPVDRALLAAAEQRGLRSGVETFDDPRDGAGRAWLSADGSGRFSSAEGWLAPARARPNLTVRTDTHVSALLVEGHRVCGVRLADGSEVAAQDTAVCAGALETPALLLRSGMRAPGIGRNLCEHPAVSVALNLREHARQAVRDRPAIGAVLRTSSSFGSGDLHLLPCHGVPGGSGDGDGDDGPHGVLVAALARARSRGTVRLNPADPDGRPLVALDLLSDERDRAAMAEGLAEAVRVLHCEAFSGLVDGVALDSSGSGAEALLDPAYADTWVPEHLGAYFHASGTCRMGPADREDAVVDPRGAIHGYPGARVIDASVLPELPRGTPHLPTVLIAERLSLAALEDVVAEGPRG